MLIHDIIKIKYVREGFLPDYPYHLTSDEEMFDAFLTQDDSKLCYFKDTYPCPEDEKLREVYETLITEIQYHIDLYLADSSRNTNIPNWVYSYMIGAVIGPNSLLYDIHDMLMMLNHDNVEDEITLEAYAEIYKVSMKYVRKLKEEEKLHRPPTIFGEPHVIKILRLEQVGI